MVKLKHKVAVGSLAVFLLTFLVVGPVAVVPLIVLYVAWMFMRGPLGVE